MSKRYSSTHCFAACHPGMFLWDAQWQPSGLVHAGHAPATRGCNRANATRPAVLPFQGAHRVPGALHLPYVSLERAVQSAQTLRVCIRMQGMSLVPAVTELMLAELLYLQYDNPTRPIFMYINSAGVQVRLVHVARLQQPRACSLDGHQLSNMCRARRKGQTSWGTSRRRSPYTTP